MVATVVVIKHILGCGHVINGHCLASAIVIRETVGAVDVFHAGAIDV